MSRLSRVIAPMLHAAGLDVRAVTGADGQVRELVITNPRHPDWGRVIVDHEGFMEWDYWGRIVDDPGAAAIATVITAIMATRPGDDADRLGRAAYQAAPEVQRTWQPWELGHEA